MDFYSVLDCNTSLRLTSPYIVQPRIDGYGFESKNWLLKEFEGPIKLGNLRVELISFKPSNFLKSQPQLQNLKSILIPLTSDEDDLPLYICWRGKPSSEFKEDRLGAFKNRLITCLKSLLETSITKLSPDSKTYRSFVCNSEKENALIVYTKEDWISLVSDFNAEEIKKAFINLKPKVFHSDEVVFLCYKLGTNKYLPIQNLDKFLETEILRYINLKAVIHATAHWAFDFPNPMCGTQTFFNPQSIADTLNTSCGIKKYFLGFCDETRSTRNSIGNIQVGRIIDNRRGVIALNMYKKNGFNDFKKNQLFHIRENGVSSFFNNCVLRGLLKQNLNQNCEFGEKQKPSAISGSQRSLVENTLEENNIGMMIKKLKVYLTRNFHNRIEVISEINLHCKDLTTDDGENKKVENLFTKSYFGAWNWCTDQFLIDPFNHFIEVDKCAKADKLGWENASEQVVNIFETYTVGLMQKSYELYENINLLKTNVDVTTYDIAACIASECLLLKFASGNFPYSKNKNMEKLLRYYAEGMQPAQHTDHTIPMIPGAAKLLAALSSPGEEDKRQICNILLPDEFNSGWTQDYTMLMVLRCSWIKVNSAAKLMDLEKALSLFFGNFLRFLLAPTRYSATKCWASGFDWNVLEATNEEWKNAFYVFRKGQIQENRENVSLNLLKYNTLDWLESSFGQTALNSRQSANYMYAYAKRSVLTLLQKKFKSSTESKNMWNKIVKEVLVKQVRTSKCPIAIEWLDTDWNNYWCLENDKHEISRKRLATKTAIKKPDTPTFRAILVVPIMDEQLQVSEFAEIYFESITYEFNTEEKFRNIRLVWLENLKKFIKRYFILFREKESLVLTLHLLRVVFLQNCYPKLDAGTYEFEYSKFFSALSTHEELEENLKKFEDNVKNVFV